jgi:hypothetical protein
MRLKQVVCGVFPSLLVCFSIGCSKADRIGYRFDFAQGPQGWIPGFADYPPADEAIYGLRADYSSLPAPLDISRSALFISGVNRSDDLFMYFRWRGGLRRNTSYRVAFEIEFATRVPAGCAGVGGAPGEGVTVKAGATTVEPIPVVGDDGHYRMNVDKGNQANGGRDAVVLGDIANSQTCGDEPRWELKQLSSMPALDVTTDDSGSVWLFFGTDSGFESITSLYYTRFAAEFEPF